MTLPRAAADEQQPYHPPKLGRDYWRLWWANAVSSTGDGAFVAALPLLAVTITRDPRLVSVVTAATYLPWMVLSLPAGALVDRHDRATLMWRVQAVQAAVVTAVAVLVVVRAANVELLALAGLLLGSAEVILSNAAQSVLPALAPAELLSRANGSQQISLTVGESFLGPPADSLLFAAAAALPFGLDAVSFAGSAALLARLPRIRESHQETRTRPDRRGPAPAGGALGPARPGQQRLPHARLGPDAGRCAGRRIRRARRGPAGPLHRRGDHLRSRPAGQHPAPADRGPKQPGLSEDDDPGRPGPDRESLPPDAPQAPELGNSRPPAGD
jgi:MFS family permease